MPPPADVITAQSNATKLGGGLGRVRPFAVRCKEVGYAQEAVEGRALLGKLLQAK
jgi:hypothetical protein